MRKFLKLFSRIGNFNRRAIPIKEPAKEPTKLRGNCKRTRL